MHHASDTADYIFGEIVDLTIFLFALTYLWGVTASSHPNEVKQYLRLSGLLGRQHV